MPYLDYGTREPVCHPGFVSNFSSYLTELQVLYTMRFLDLRVSPGTPGSDVQLGSLQNSSGPQEI